MRRARDQFKKGVPRYFWDTLFYITFYISCKLMIEICAKPPASFVTISLFLSLAVQGLILYQTVSIQCELEFPDKLPVLQYLHSPNPLTSQKVPCRLCQLRIQWCRSAADQSGAGKLSFLSTFGSVYSWLFQI